MTVQPTYKLGRSYLRLQMIILHQRSGMFLSAQPLVMFGLIVSQVTFLLTEDPNYTTESRGSKKKRKRRRTSEPLSPDRFSLYSSLSSLSGGLTIFTTNSDIRRVSAIMKDNTAADKVSFHGDQHFTQLNQIKHVPEAKKVSVITNVWKKWNYSVKYNLKKPHLYLIILSFHDQLWGSLQLSHIFINECLLLTVFTFWPTRGSGNML